MTDKKAELEKFFKNSDLTPEKLAEIVKEGLKGSDYGEFYQEIVATENLVKDKGSYSSISTGNGSSGFGFRVGKSERVGYAYSAVFNEKSLNETVAKARKVLNTKESSVQAPSSGRVSQKLYPTQNPMNDMDLAEKIAKMDEIEAYVKTLHEDITNVTLAYSAKSVDVHVMTADGQSLVDTRPITTLSIGITVKDKDGNSETGSALIGGRITCKDAFNEAAYKQAAQKALKQAQTLLIADEAPAGTMDVVLSAGWPAVLLHEAVGHGLEGDFNRKNISVYSGKIGQQVASPNVTIVDQGDMPGERGSLHFDDEGTPTQENVLVENGILKGYMHDRQSAHLTNSPLTGNGRRESYEHLPMPRMTNTYFRAGNDKPEDIIKSVKDGLYISDMGGGQVDITSGKFNMVATLAYRIRDGKICEPVKGATLTGDGLTVIKSITKVGNDLELEKSAGMCGKNGQNVPVSCGQPTICVSNMTVGGTK